jgi:hypothetical protein
MPSKSSHSENKFNTTVNGLGWKDLRLKMNEEKLTKTGKPINSNMSSREEFFKIMEKLSKSIWCKYHPNEDPNEPENKKHIKNIARSEYFSILVENALFEQDLINKK